MRQTIIDRSLGRSLLEAKILLETEQESRARIEKPKSHRLAKSQEFLTEVMCFSYELFRGN